MSKHYLWDREGGDDMRGDFATVEEAVADAKDLLSDSEEPVTIEVWSTRPATHQDREDFEGHEDVDVNEPNWWERCVVPEDVVHTETLEIGTPKLFPTCEAVGHCERCTIESAPFHHFYWDSDRDTARMEKIHGPGGKGHDDPLAAYTAVMCKTCGFRALVHSEADDLPQI